MKTAEFFAFSLISWILLPSIGAFYAIQRHSTPFSWLLSSPRRTRSCSVGGKNLFLRSTATTNADLTCKTLGGKIVVSGIGEVEEDEFMLSLLNEQSIWEKIILLTPSITTTRKRFLSRTARYSGLLNILDLVELDNDLSQSVDKLRDILEGSDAWLAFNLTQQAVPLLSSTALDAGVKRAVFTVSLPPNHVNDTFLPEFQDALHAFESKGASFTGIRHGTIIEGDENKPYEIFNASQPCIEDTVERGVLARVAAELLRLTPAFNKECGVSSSSEFAGAYLNILRSTGLTRQEEVYKVFSGSVQRLARLTLNTWESEEKSAREAAEAAKKAKEEEDQRKSLEIRDEEGHHIVIKSDGTAIDFDADSDSELSEEDLVRQRGEEILHNIWREYNVRMYTKSTSKQFFFDKNREQAHALAAKEIAEERAQKAARDLEKEATKVAIDKIVDVQERQYSKLLALERKEMASQQVMSDVWVRFVYLLLKETMALCEVDGVLFHNLDEYQQTLILRKQANNLRAACGLPPYDVVYDPLDANEIVVRLSTQSIGEKYQLQRPSEEILSELNTQFGDLLRNVAALRGAAQIIDLAIDTLRKELPPHPPSPLELRQQESEQRQKVTSARRLDGIKQRGQPPSNGEEAVGRL
eukprot:gene1789-1957_t